MLWHFNTVGTRKITQHDVVRKAFDGDQKLSVPSHSSFLAAIERVSLSPRALVSGFMTWGKSPCSFTALAQESKAFKSVKELWKLQWVHVSSVIR